MGHKFKSFSPAWNTARPRVEALDISSFGAALTALGVQLSPAQVRFLLKPFRFLGCKFTHVYALIIYIYIYICMYVCVCVCVCVRVCVCHGVRMQFVMLCSSLRAYYRRAGSSSSTPSGYCAICASALGSSSMFDYNHLMWELWFSQRCASAWREIVANSSDRELMSLFLEAGLVGDSHDQVLLTPKEVLNALRLAGWGNANTWDAKAIVRQFGSSSVVSIGALMMGMRNLMT